MPGKTKQMMKKIKKRPRQMRKVAGKGLRKANFLKKNSKYEKEGDTEMGEEIKPPRKKKTPELRMKVVMK